MHRQISLRIRPATTLPAPLGIQAAVSEVEAVLWNHAEVEEIEVQPEVPVEKRPGRAERHYVKNGDVDLAWKMADLHAKAAHLGKSCAGDPDGSLPEVSHLSAVSLYC